MQSKNLRHAEQRGSDAIVRGLAWHTHPHPQRMLLGETDQYWITRSAAGMQKPATSPSLLHNEMRRGEAARRGEGE